MKTALLVDNAVAPRSSVSQKPREAKKSWYGSGQVSTIPAEYAPKLKQVRFVRKNVQQHNMGQKSCKQAYDRAFQT